MKRAIIIPLIALAACSKTTPIDEQHEAISAQIDALEHSLPAECKTSGIVSQIEALRMQTVAEVSVCYTSLQEEQIKTTKANIRFYTLLVIFIGLLIGFIKKKGWMLWS